MPEISLRDYLAKLNNLLNANAADEVIHHCRHILQYFPKNVAAYRFLGRGLSQNGRWDEAGAALLRVLSVIPDDFAALVGMSEVLIHQNRHDEAIWHLERAYEQRSGEKDLVDGLRELYRRYRGVDSAKLPLTAAAVARQSLRSGSYDQAIEKLRDALSRAEARVDLRLLLAQALWLKDARLEAAELAMDVLEVLPDCLEANRVLSELWLAEGRPSDAQRYINRIESVDPYLAVELVQNQPADDNAFRLEELDYRLSAQSELAQERPDWLQGITPASTPMVEDSAPVEDQWSEWVSAMLQGAEKPSPASEPAEEEDWMATVKRPDSGSLNKYQPASPDELEEIEALFNAEIDLNTPVKFDSEAQEDPVAWLRDAGVDFVDEAEASAASRPTFDEDEFRLPEAEDNPMAWLDRYHDEQRAEETPAQTPAEADDALPDWMRDIELPPLDSEDEFEKSTPATAAVADSDQPLAWLEEDFLTDAALDAESPTELPPTEALTFARSETLADESSLWERELSDIDDDDDQVVTAAAPADVPQGVPGPKRGLTSLLNDSEFAWTEESAAADTSDDDWLSLFDDRRKTAELATTAPDWLAELDTSAAPGTESPASTDEFESETEVETGEEFGWMTASEDEETDEDQKEAAMAPEMPDWLSSLDPNKRDQDDTEPESLPAEPGDDEFEWMTSLDDEVAAASSNMPDWLSELDPSKRDDEDGDLEPLPPIEDDDELEWMSASTSETSAADDEFAELDELPLAEPEVPDWLSELEPNAAGETPSQPAPLPIDMEEDFEWMSAIEDAEVDEVEQAAETAETPDWLTQIQASRQEEMAQQPQGIPTEAEDDLEWVDALEEDEVERAAEPAEIPDWLSEMQATQQTTEPETVSEAGQPATPSADEEFEWMTSLDTSDEGIPAEPILEGETIDEFGELDEVELAAAETPDWLAELEPKSEQTQAKPEPVSAGVEDEFDWLDDDVGEPPAVEPAAASMPDWLQEIKPVEAEALGEPEPAAPSSEGYEWLDSALSETKVDFDDEPVPAADVPDWIAAFDDVNIEDDDTLHLAASEAGEFDAITGANALQTEGQPSDDELFEEMLMPTPADNAPDWLNAMVPGFDVDYAPVEEEALEPVDERTAEPASREYGWLVNIVEEETRTAPRTTFTFSRPPAWLDLLAPPAQSEVPQADDDFPDWPSEEDGELPEWLR